MTLKKTLHALESPPAKKEGTLQRLIAKYQHHAQKAQCSLKPSLLSELLSYIKRNPVSQTSLAPEKNLCPHCAKAHLLAWAQKEQFPAEELHCLKKALPGSQGHDGYYLDGENLCKVPAI